MNSNEKLALQEAVQLLKVLFSVNDFMHGPVPSASVWLLVFLIFLKSADALQRNY